METALDRYHVVEKVGEGTYGLVFKAFDKRDGNKPVAIKKINLESEDDGIPTTAIREVSLLKNLRHVNIIRLLDVMHGTDSLYLVFDLVDTDLKQCMDSQIQGLSMPTIRSYLHQLLSGVAYCHASRVLHRDLKPQNLLIDRTTGLLLLADFGLSRNFRLPDRSYTHEVVTLWYRPPEVLLGSAHCTTSVDLWSVGCIFAEMLTGRPAFPGESEIDQLFRIFHALGTPNEATAPYLCSLPAFQPSFPRWHGEPISELGGERATESALDLLSRLLVCDPKRRISAREALEHEFFADVHAPVEDEAWPEPPTAGASEWPSTAARAIPFEVPAVEPRPPSAAGSRKRDDPWGTASRLADGRRLLSSRAQSMVDIAAAAEALPTGLTPPAMPRARSSLMIAATEA